MSSLLAIGIVVSEVGCRRQDVPSRASCHSLRIGIVELQLMTINKLETKTMIWSASVSDTPLMKAVLRLVTSYGR